MATEENLELLGNAIDVELVLEAQEKSVGPFRADILCKDRSTDDWVLIENQLARTDHTHLGQLITYAAGLKAVTIVWIANPFTEEHRAALDWMNEITDGRFNFFGLEVELWRIGDSHIAPKFNVISKPNDWSRTVTASAQTTELSDTKRLQLEFWTHFKTYVHERGSTVRTTKPLPQHWMNLAIGRSGFQLSAIASLWNSNAETYDTNEVRAEFVIATPYSDRYFELLLSKKEEIESAIGYPLIWYSPVDKQMKRVYVRRDADLSRRESWPELQQWLIQSLEDLKTVFGDRVKALPSAEELIAEMETV